MGVRVGGKVEKVNGRELSYTDFVEKYMARNEPVILTGLTDDWRASKDWTAAADDEGQKPNLQFFATHFGASTVQVADCGTKEFTDQKRVEMSVSQFIDHWMKNSCEADSKPLYLKDWHFVKEYPEYIPYSTPLFFLDDWLNLYLDKYRIHVDTDIHEERNEISCSDYRFVYMGAKGTWTPLHADVFRSYSWSANVCGRKQWYFLHPSEHHLVFDRYMKNSVYDIFEDVSESKYPGFEKVRWLECTQEQNEVIFVPSGWYHQVHNLEDTISINHNWFNGYNISWVWDLLLREYHEAKGYIEDIRDICDDFEGLCQKNLAANAGMNFTDFFIFIVRVALANLVLLHQLTSSARNINRCSSQMAQLLLFNLSSIRGTASKMISGNACVDHHIAAINIRETVEDQPFIEFCNSLRVTYGMISGLSDMNFNLHRTSLEDKESKFFDFNSSHIRNPVELVTLVDRAFEFLDLKVDEHICDSL